MPNPVVFKPETITLYDKRVDADRFHTIDDKKGGAFTLHHIIPYRYAYFIGHLFHTITSTGVFESANADPDVRQLLADMKKICNALLPVACKFNGSDLIDPAKTADLGGKFAWMGANLFVGPSSSVRVDDPGSNPEPICPGSFDAEHWSRIHAIKTLVDAMVVSIGSSADDAAAKVQLVTFKQHLFGSQVSGLIRHLTSLAGYSKHAHPYDPDDWIIIDLATRDEHKHEVTIERQIRHGVTNAVIKTEKLTKTITGIGDLKELYRSMPEGLGDEFMEFRPTKHRHVPGLTTGSTAPAYAVLWRLWVPGTPKPKHSMPGNFMFQ